MVLNPDVTVRQEGYRRNVACVFNEIQKKLTAKKDSRKVNGWKFRTACASGLSLQDAITFGDF